MIIGVFCLLVINKVFSQQTLVLQPNPTNGKDAHLSELNPGRNYATHLDFISYDWTFSGIEGVGKSLLQFYLSSLPVNIQITSAKLSLYHNSSTSSAGQAGENACYLKKVTGQWEENTVTWNTAPTTTSSGAITLAKSTTATQDYLDIDITDFVKGWYSDPSTNYGLMLELINETLYSSMKFCSSDVSDPLKRPKLVITYEFLVNSIVLQPNAENGKDAHLSELNPNRNYATHLDFISYDWTFSGIEGLGKSLLQFDLSSLPANVQITSAKLSLYHNSSTSSAGQAGENACYLKKVTGPWEKNTVTWNTAPTTTSSGAVTLAKSTTASQNYLDIDITDFVSEWYSDPSTNYGLMLELINETLYSSMKFCSSDVSDPLKRPKLVITYNSLHTKSITKGTKSYDEIKVYPNPFFNIVKIFMSNTFDSDYTIEVYNNCGTLLQILKKDKLNSDVEVDLTDYPAGLYMLKIYNLNNCYYRKIVKK